MRNLRLWYVAIVVPSMFCASPGLAVECENLIALSKTVTSTVADKSAFNSHAEKFCSEYHKSESSGGAMTAGASYKFLSASFGKSTMSAAEVASKVCYDKKGELSTTDAYEQYVETIATGAYSAYETCVRFKGNNDLQFDVDLASVLPAEFTITIGYMQSVQGADTSDLVYSGSKGVACTWNGKPTETTKLKAPSSVAVKCTRPQQGTPGYVKFTRTNGVGGSLTVPWPAFDKNGIPVATLEGLKTQLFNTETSLTQMQKQIGALSAANAKQVYICPIGKTIDNKNASWAYYGCQGQITTQHECSNIEYILDTNPDNDGANTEVRPCDPAGLIKLYQP